MTPATPTKWRKNVLVVANVTAGSDELLAALQTRAGEQPTACTLIVPATPSETDRAADRERLGAAVERLRAAGLEVEGRIADSDPIVAVSEAWDPRRYDEIVVSTLPMDVSKWLHAGLPKRIGELTGALVTHVVSEPPRPPVVLAPPRPHEKSALGPLSVLGWGRHSKHS
jgi:GABA permease